MSNYIYKCVPAPMEVETDLKTANKHDKAANIYQSKINIYAKEGWELHDIYPITSVEKPGCLASIFGGKPVQVTYNMIVFRRRQNE